MRIRYRYARSLLAGFLAVVLLFSLVPAASAAQQNSYHDPAENWKEALDRTNELDANAVVTHETFDCAYAKTSYTAAKAVVADYYGVADGAPHTVTVSDLSEAGVTTAVRYGHSADACTLTSAPNYTEAGNYTVYYEITYT